MHQGIIWNDEDLKKQFKFDDRNGETDSWAIIYLIEFYRKNFPVLQSIIKTHQKLQGSWACVYLDKFHPENVYLFCHDKTIKVVYLPEEKIFWFSTEEKELDNILIKNNSYFDIFEEIEIPKRASYVVDDNECLILNESPKLHFLPEPKIKYKWENKNKNWEEDLKEYYKGRKNKSIIKM